MCDFLQKSVISYRIYDFLRIAFFFHLFKFMFSNSYAYRFLQVTNCTRHGQWTEWSEWGACSQSCDIGQKQRHRTCGNPSPAFGGQPCIGQDRDTDLCKDLPVCASGTKSALATASLTRYTGTKYVM